MFETARLEEIHVQEFHNRPEIVRQPNQGSSVGGVEQRRCVPFLRVQPIPLHQRLERDYRFLFTKRAEPLVNHARHIEVHTTCQRREHFLLGSRVRHGGLPNDQVGLLLLELFEDRTPHLGRSELVVKKGKVHALQLRWGVLSYDSLDDLGYDLFPFDGYFFYDLLYFLYRHLFYDFDHLGLPAAREGGGGRSGNT